MPEAKKISSIPRKDKIKTSQDRQQDKSRQDKTRQRKKRGAEEESTTEERTRREHNKTTITRQDNNHELSITRQNAKFLSPKALTATNNMHETNERENEKRDKTT